MPLVSVVIAVRDGARLLRDALDCATAQTLTDLEIIVVDDGSTDSTPAIIAEFAARDPRVRTLRGPATGSAGDARNAGLEVATGDYLAFWDADDQFGPTLLQDLHTRARADRADIVVTKFRVSDLRTGQAVPVEWGARLEFFPSDLPVSPAELGDALLIAVNPAPWNKLYRTGFLRAASLRFPSLRRSEDVHFTALALVQAQRLSYLDGYAIDYRVGDETSLQATRDEAPLEFVDALHGIRSGFKRLGRWPDLERALANLTVELALTALRRAGSVETFSTLHQALRDQVFPGFGVTGRPAEFFLRREYARQVHAIMRRSTSELLFDRLTAATRQADRAKSETRAVLLGLGAPPRPDSGQQTGDPLAGEADEVALRQPAGDPHAGGDRSSAPDVTVIVPVFNTERYLQECLASTREQTGVELQVICVDDGSTDGSRTLLAQLAEQDTRLLVLHQEHAGQSVARNAALAHATGRYVCFLDSDDYWQSPAALRQAESSDASPHPTSLAELVEYADGRGLDLLMFDAETSREPGVPDQLWEQLHAYYQRPAGYGEPTTGPLLLSHLKANGHYRASACLYLMRRDLLGEHRLQFHPGIKYEDNLFTFAALLAAARAAHLPAALYGRRLRPGSTMSASVRAIRARGYFVCAVEMLRLARRRQFEPEVATQVAAVIHRVYQHARAAALRLDPDLIAGLGALYPGDPDAQLVTALLAEARAVHQRDATPSPHAGPPTLPARPAGHRQADRALRTVKDVVRRVTRSS